MHTKHLSMTTQKSDDVPSLGEVRVPSEAVYAVYKPMQALELVHIDNHPLVQFGLTGSFGKLLIDPESKKVMEIHDGSTISFVNSSLEKYADCLQFFANLLSEVEGAVNSGGDNEGDDEDENEALAQKLEEGIREIDPCAYRENSYWYEIRWDVSLGDYA